MQVGPSYGRKMMTGFLASLGFRVSQQRVGFSLKRVNPCQHWRRQRTLQRLINPVPYTAAYFGEKLHIDQNEKLVMYGVTHVCAVDGFSGKIVGFVSMPVKSNGIIYEKLYRYRHITGFSCFTKGLNICCFLVCLVSVCHILR